MIKREGKGKEKGRGREEGETENKGGEEQRIKGERERGEYDLESSQPFLQFGF